MPALAEYEHRRETAARQMRIAAAANGTVALRKSTSNLFRARDQRGARKLDVRAFRHVLRVDRERMVAEVEGMTPYAALVEATLRCGFLPLVTPQLKTITVGGAVSGIGIESSSFRCGLVHDGLEEMEVLLGDGRTLTCSREENADLFRGFPNSYGTLGYALRLTIRLMPSRPFVRLTHTRFSESEAYFDEIARVCEDGSADFVDGTVFGAHEMYLTGARGVASAPFTSDYTWLNIYYKSIRQRTADYLSIRDYIWRWDTDWFWCSKQFYAQHLPVRLLATKWLLNSITWQRIMRLSQRVSAAANGTESVIQDVDIPIEGAPDFLAFLLSEIGITPIWICPFRTGTDGTPWPLYALEPRKLYINFGFWDVIRSDREPGHYNRRVEQRARELHGKKGLYASAWYDRETFADIYNGRCYALLKDRYDPDGVFPDLYQKCVERR